MEYFVSGNGKYFLCISGDGIFTVRSSDGRVSVSDIPSSYLVGGKRASVSKVCILENGGKYLDIKDNINNI